MLRLDDGIPTRVFRVRARGFSPASTLMLVAVLLSLGLTVVGASLHHLGVTRRLGNLQQARQNAESVLALAVEKLLAQQELGQAADLPLDQAMNPRSSNGSGRLSFSHALPEFPYSTNNLGGDSTLAGYAGRAVPPHCADLWGVGECNGVVRKVEMIVSFPPFPYAIACTGPFSSDGNLFLAGIQHPQDLIDGQIPPEKMLPAHLLSDGLGPKAVELGPNTLVSGDLRSAGEVMLNPQNCRVDGQLVSNGPTLSIPKLDLTSLDPQLLGRSPILDLPLSQATRPGYQGFVRRQGDLNILQGLTLDNGVLYVQGNLRIQGGVRGVGAVLATGSMEIEGSTSLNTDDRLALVSGGPLSLRGGAADDSFFQGLVYSGGPFQADRITLVGSLIVQAEQQPSRLRQSSLIGSSDLAQIEIHPGGLIPLLFTVSGSNRSGGDDALVIHVAREAGGFTVKNPDTSVVSSSLSADQAVAQVLAILAAHQMADSVNAVELLERLQALPLADQGVQAPGPAYTINPSLFLKAEERMRVIFWQET